MNIHCQPFMPATPSNVCISQPDSGPPSMPASGIEAVNSALKRARRFNGTQ